MHTARATLAADRTLLDLVARWYATALDRVLQEGLARDYRPSLRKLPAARGRVQVLPTTRRYYQGHIEISSVYQEFDFDTPLNRVLLHAARLLVKHTAVSGEVRTQVGRAVLRMEDVGSFQVDDLNARPERRTSYYGDAVLLAHHLINGIGRKLVVGDEQVWTFLVRTPEAVEHGLRHALLEALPTALKPSKTPLTLKGTKMKLNPDLVFGRKAIADVKYKVSEDKWRREDLYQLVTYATGFEVGHAAMIDFQAEPTSQLETISVGDVQVAHLVWPSTEECTPQAAHEQLARQIVQWARGWS
jgi:5-methylcytosine-specific restriction endonuclease McrBC regulatory subunit McrC